MADSGERKSSCPLAVTIHRWDSSLNPSGWSAPIAEADRTFRREERGLIRAAIEGGGRAIITIVKPDWVYGGKSSSGVVVQTAWHVPKRHDVCTSTREFEFRAVYVPDVAPIDFTFILTADCKACGGAGFDRKELLVNFTHPGPPD